MKKFLLVLLTLGLYLGSANSKEIEISSMECEVTNFFGYKLGTAELQGSEILMNFGMFGNLLWINEISENAIVAMTKDQSWDYIFAFEEKFALEQNEYTGILYQQYVMGYGGPKIPFAKLSCQLLF